MKKLSYFYNLFYMQIITNKILNQDYLCRTVCKYHCTELTTKQFTSNNCAQKQSILTTWDDTMLNVESGKKIGKNHKMDFEKIFKCKWKLFKHETWASNVPFTIGNNLTKVIWLISSKWWILQVENLAVGPLLI